jgi:hypothetical protein
VDAQLAYSFAHASGVAMVATREAFDADKDLGAGFGVTQRLSPVSNFAIRRTSISPSL